MTSGWPLLSLREGGISLLDCEHRTPSAQEYGYPYIAIPQLKSGRLDLAEARRISGQDFEDWTRKTRPQSHDVILSRRCNPGETAVVPPGLQCALGQNLVLLRPDPRRIFPPFLRWLVRGPRWWEEVGRQLNVGAVFDSLKCADIPNFQLMFPPLPQQAAIADILGTLDDKIDLNRRMNQTLEAMAQALFRSWFVDFDPVRAKAEGRQPVGMDAETAALFPNSFQALDGGHVPTGWRWSQYRPGLTVAKGKSYSSDELRPSTTALVTLKSFLRGGGYRDDGLKDFVGPFRSEQVVKPGELVVAFTDVTQAAEVIGRPALVRKSPRHSTLIASLDVGIVRPLAPELPVEFLYFAFQQDAFNVHTYGRSNGSTVLHLAPEAIQEFVGLWPTVAVAQRFKEFVQRILEKREATLQESETLANLRDTLLPKLLSGEIRIKDAERAAAASGDARDALAAAVERRA